ncbi:MAG: GtrA family protein [Bacillota bacterium]
MIGRQAAFFVVAGAIGFVVDAGVLQLALALGAGPYIGRLISFFSAVFTTWQVNRRFTFARRERAQSTWSEWWRYVYAMIFGGLLNLATYVLVIRTVDAGSWTPLLGVAVGSLVGMVANFLTSKLWVFRA